MPPKTPFKKRKRASSSASANGVDRVVAPTPMIHKAVSAPADTVEKLVNFLAEEEIADTQEIAETQELVATQPASYEDELEPLAQAPAKRKKSTTDVPARFIDKLYLVTTENVNWSKIRSLPLKGNTWIGCNVLFNLDAVSVRGADITSGLEISHIYIVDISAKVDRLAHFVVDILQTTESAALFQTALEQHLIQNRSVYGSQAGNILQLRMDIAKGRSFLSNQQRYNTIRAMALDGRIIHRSYNLGNEQHMQRLLRELAGNDLT